MRTKNILVLSVIAGINLLPAAQAEGRDDRWYVAPYGTFINSGGERNAKDDWGGGLGVGKMLNEHFNAELKGFYQRFDGNAGGNWDLTGGTADLQFYISRDTFAPYTVFGLGAMNTSHGGYSGTGFIGEAGAGFTYALMDNLLIRSDVRYRYNKNFNSLAQTASDEFHDMTVNVGLVIPLGPKPAQTAVQTEPQAPVTADCSTLDEDSDGINNCADRCPNSLSGIQVSKYGCWIVEVKFDHDKDNIKPQYYPYLDNVAEAIKNHPEIKIEVQGHTSKTGSFKHNMALSERRAKAVKDYLSRGSLSPNLTSRGYGWTRPVDTNETEEGRANNRRVQLEVDGKPQARQ